MPATPFSDRLSLVLKALSVTRGRLAADLAVDKSLVGRWCSGSVTPSAHNLARLTQAIAVRQPGFTMLDWEVPLTALAARFGVELEPAPTLAPSGVPSAFAEWLQLPKLRDAALASGPTSHALAGHWRTTRPIPELPGRFAHDQVLMEATPDGPLSFRIGLFSARFVGWAMAVNDQLFCCATNKVTGSSLFAIFNRVHRPRIDVLDGVTIACMADAGGVPVASACLVERIGELSGDAATDEARYEALLAEHPIVPEDGLPDAVRRHLYRDTGPTALAAGGDPIIMMRSMASMARGSTPG